MKRASDTAAKLAARPMRAHRRQLVQPPTAKTLPPGVTEPASRNPRDFSPIEVKPYKPKDDRDQVGNPHKVNQSAWRKWDGQARRMFNSLYSFMVLNQGLFHHPNQAKLDPKMWNTVAHNAAWTAAEAVMGRYSGDEMGDDRTGAEVTRVLGKARPSPAKKKPAVKAAAKPVAKTAAKKKAKA